MITLRTKTLLCLVALCGLGIGMLAPFSDGIYSAVLLFVFPFLAVFMALSIGVDLGKVPAREGQGRGLRETDEDIFCSTNAANHFPES